MSGNGGWVRVRNTSSTDGEPATFSPFDQAATLFTLFQLSGNFLKVTFQVNEEASL